VVDQRTVHLAGRRRLPSAGRTHLVDSSVCAVVFVEIEGSATHCRQALLCQRLRQVTTTRDVRDRWFISRLDVVQFHGGSCDYDFAVTRFDVGGTVDGTVRRQIGEVDNSSKSRLVTKSD